MKILPKFTAKKVFASIGLTTSMFVCQNGFAFDHTGMQWSVGAGANFSRNEYLTDGESNDLRINRGYNFSVDYGYGLGNQFTAFLSYYNNFYKSSLKGDQAPEPFWMQQAFIGPSLRYYLKAHEPSFYFQAGYGYGYYSVSDVANFETNRHFGTASTFTVGYEMDKYMNFQINYMFNDIQSSSLDDNGLSSNSISFSINYHPR